MARVRCRLRCQRESMGDMFSEERKWLVYGREKGHGGSSYEVCVLQIK